MAADTSTDPTERTRSAAGGAMTGQTGFEDAPPNELSGGTSEPEFARATGRIRDLLGATTTAE